MIYPPRAVLLIDNAPSHPNTEELTSGEITTAFLPPNATPLLQPMDQNVLQSLKLKYRKKFLRNLIEDEAIPLVDKIKQTNIKDVVYWAAESWEKVTVHMLRKSWTKLWPSLEFEDNGPEHDGENLLQLVQTIPGCEDADAEDVNEWMGADSESSEILSDADIITAVTQESSVCEEERSDDEIENDRDVVSHADATAALDLALQYLEQQATATPADIMFMRRWRNFASSNRLSSLRQKTITDFMSSNN